MKKLEWTNIDSYPTTQLPERVDFLYENYYALEDLIEEYKENIIAEVIEQKSYNKRSEIGELGVRVCTSLGMSNTTQKKSLEHLSIEEAIDTGYLTEEFFEYTDDRQMLINKVECYHEISRDATFMMSKIKMMKPADRNVIEPYLLKKKSLNELAQEMSITYDSAKKRISRIKKKLEANFEEKMAS